jgi:hypothetical protein
MVNLTAERRMNRSGSAVSSEPREADRAGANRNRFHAGGRNGSEGTNKLDVGQTGISTLHEAAKKKDAEAARELLRRGRERGALKDLLNARDIRRRTALHIAAGWSFACDPKDASLLLEWITCQLDVGAVPEFFSACMKTGLRCF